MVWPTLGSRTAKEQEQEHQLQVERKTGKVRRPETDVLPLCHATRRRYTIPFRRHPSSGWGTDRQGCRGDGISIPIPMGITIPTADLRIVSWADQRRRTQRHSRCEYYSRQQRSLDVSASVRSYTMMRSAPVVPGVVGGVGGSKSRSP